MGGVLLTAQALSKDRVDGVVVVTFARPEIRSPLSINVLEELDDTLGQIRTDPTVSALIFTGMNDVFASGADLKEIARVVPESAKTFAERGQHLMDKIAGLAKPTIAAINGYCFGGALDLALSCDHRIASPTAKFAHPGARLGIITGWGGTQRVPRLVGTSKALEIFFTAAPISANEALAIGLVDEIVDEVSARSMELALSLV